MLPGISIYGWPPASAIRASPRGAEGAGLLSDSTLAAYRFRFAEGKQEGRKPMAGRGC
mgnify:CR=1 FL=1